MSNALALLRKIAAAAAAPKPGPMGAAPKAPNSIPNLGRKAMVTARQHPVATIAGLTGATVAGVGGTAAALAGKPEPKPEPSLMDKATGAAGAAWDKTKEMAGQGADWVKANPGKAVGFGAAGVGAAMLLHYLLSNRRRRRPAAE